MTAKNFGFGVAFTVIIPLILMSGCVTTGKTTYLQELGDHQLKEIKSVPEDYRVVPNDNLYLRVIAPDPKFSDMFNTIPASSSTLNIDGQALDILSYRVQHDGTIEIPYLGKITVAGKTLPEIKDIMEEELADYVSDAAITVKLVNNYISILGEVVRPGRYPIFKENMNVLHAISMAGDLSVYGNRTEIQLVREMKDSIIVKNLDLTRRDLIYSEDFYVMPNDVIYVKPIKGKFFAMSQFPFALILSTITSFILVLNYIQKSG